MKGGALFGAHFLSWYMRSFSLNLQKKIVTDQEEIYLTSHSMAEPKELGELYRDTHLRRLYPRMCCEPLQGRLLVMLTRMIGPRRILELGTFSGYSTLCFAEGMPEDCQIHTVEIDDEAEPQLRQLFDNNPRRADIKLHIGNALDLIEPLSALHSWDLVYIDANKRHYADYYRLVKPYVRPGGYIFADNTMWSDAVLNSDATDAQTEGIRRFNDMVAADSDVEPVMLPLYDGLTLIRKKP